MRNITDRSNRRLIVLLALLFVVSAVGFADSQFDITLSWPYYSGLQNASGSFGDFNQYMFIVPDVKWHWYFGEEWLQFGVGLQAYTLIVESMVYPHIGLQSILGDFVLNAGVGGGTFLFFGLINQFEAGAVFIPEFSVAYRLGKKKLFSLGAGALFIIAPEVVDLDAFVFVGTLFARFTL